MHTTYDGFLTRMINRYEGGYGWHPADPGGPTKYGITCFDLAKHRNKKMTSMATWAPLVKALSLQEAEDIYWANYAVPIRYNDLPIGIDCCLMDYAVNSGIGRALTVANAIAGTGQKGMNNALMKYLQGVNPQVFVNKLCAERLNFLKRLKTWGTFGKGWNSRVSDLKAYCNNLITHTPHTEPVPSPNAVGALGKGHVEGTPKTNGSAAIIAGIGASTALWINNGLTGWGLAVAIAAAVIVGVMIAMHQERELSEAKDHVEVSS